MKNFDAVISFHGHACPGLALGFRVSVAAISKLGRKAADEEIVAIVENNSCAVDAVQMVTGCTFGKGNLIFHDYGKQVYTFLKRPLSSGIRISVHWEAPAESRTMRSMWNRYRKGDHSHRVLDAVHDRKALKIDAIMNAKDGDLFRVSKIRMIPPAEAAIYPSLTCSMCKEKVMEPRARIKNGKPVCIPCSLK